MMMPSPNQLTLLTVLLTLTTFTHAAKIRYIPFGDSITDYGCWRAWIYERLHQSENLSTEIDFVGTTRTSKPNCRDTAVPKRPTRKTADIIAVLGKLIDQMRDANSGRGIIHCVVAYLACRPVEQLHELGPEGRRYPSERASGDIKMADKFYPAIVQAIRSIQGMTYENGYAEPLSLAMNVGAKYLPSDVYNNKYREGVIITGIGTALAGENESGNIMTT
ncbi:hypothetical protein B0H66DRAFT_592056 [Apodospora peruviana]|uniref:Uncharacterized protein n=1 Tax=Apodospora peruviana TaxID=516989 RepID=A0AAE0M1K7_9PEZI|nr:hypothetical protein B0H66DRAFT_592056 [Apodospora peruviana]